MKYINTDLTSVNLLIVFISNIYISFLFIIDFICYRRWSPFKRQIKEGKHLSRYLGNYLCECSFCKIWFHFCRLWTIWNKYKSCRIPVTFSVKNLFSSVRVVLILNACTYHLVPTIKGQVLYGTINVFPERTTEALSLCKESMVKLLSEFQVTNPH